jgi:hypothetical protein
LRDSVTGQDLEVVAAVDHDPETAEKVGGLVDHLLYSDTYRGCSKAWNDCLAVSSGDPVVFAADDLVWERGWLDHALGELAGFEDGWGLVGFNDGHWDQSLSTHYLMSRRFIVEVLGGVVAWDFYKHSYNDLETCDRAKAAGRYRWCKDAHVRHEHWTWGTRDRDETDTRRLGDHPQDTEHYRRRVAAGFPNDGIVPVIA